eukprot:6600610-Ditylum_brightwellii.AAC.1
MEVVGLEMEEEKMKGGDNDDDNSVESGLLFVDEEDEKLEMEEEETKGGVNDNDDSLQSESVNQRVPPEADEEE